MTSSTDDFEEEARLALDAAVRGGGVLMDHYRRGVEAETKDGGEPVSVADRDADLVISEAIRTAFPNDGILSEEGKVDGATDPSRVWVIDPLDGTRDFLAGVPEFAVHVALAVDGVAAVGAVFDPAARRGGVAILGRGCREFDERGLRGPLRMPRKDGRLRVLVSRSRFGPDQERLLACLQPAETIRCGSSGCKVLRLVFGEADVYLGATPGMSAWDLAAPQRVLDEAGGRGTDLLGGALRYRRSATRMTRGFLGTGADRHAEIARRLAPGLATLPWLP